MGGTSQGEATVYQKHRALLTRKWMCRQLLEGGTSQGEATVYQKHRALLTRKWNWATFKRWHKPGRSDCLSKTQGSANKGNFRKVAQAREKRLFIKNTGLC